MVELGTKAVYVVAIATVLTVIVRGLSQSKSLWIGCSCTLFTVGMFGGEELWKQVHPERIEHKANSDAGEKAQSAKAKNGTEASQSGLSFGIKQRPTPGDLKLGVKVTDHP